MNINILFLVQLGILLILCVYNDLKTYRIPNKIVCPFMVLGIITNTCFYGIEGLKKSVLGIAVPIILLFVLYVIRMIGAGDVKMFSAIGSIMGWKFAAGAVIYSFFAGALIGIFILIRRKNAKERFKYLLQYVTGVILQSKFSSYADFEDKKDGAKFHFSISILIGTLVCFVLLREGLFSF